MLDKATIEKFSGLVPPIKTAEDLFSRCSVQLSNELGCDIHDIEIIKLRVAGSILKCNNESPKSWSDFPSAIPDANATLPLPRSTGFLSVDTVLDGGLPSHKLVEVLGMSGSGKTQFCLSTAIACARCGLKVLILNTSNDISIYRIRRMLDFAMSQDQRLSTEQRQDIKLHILSNLFVQPVFDLWSAMDLLCKVRELQLYDVVLVDSLHHLVAPYLTPSDSGRSTSVSAAFQPLGGGVVAVNCQPLVTQLMLLLRALVAAGATVLVTNVLEKERAGASLSVGGRSSSVGGGAPQQWTTLRLPQGTGSAGTDMSDLVLVLSRNEAQDSPTETSFTASESLSVLLSWLH